MLLQECRGRQGSPSTLNPEDESVFLRKLAATLGEHLLSV